MMVDVPRGRPRFGVVSAYIVIARCVHSWQGSAADVNWVVNAVLGTLDGVKEREAQHNRQVRIFQKREST